MQWIKLVPEDAGIQNLQIDSRRPVVTRDVDAVSPYPSAHAPKIGEGNRRGNGRHADRRSGERRSGEDRRKQQIPVLLDTRCKHDRRAIGNRRVEDAIRASSKDTPSGDDEQTPPRKHLNLYV